MKIFELCQLGRAVTNCLLCSVRSVQRTLRTTLVKEKFGWKVEIAQKPESNKGFIPQKNRWQVERSFSWLNFRRRLFKDVEKLTESSQAMLQIAFISLIINRL